MKHPTQIPGCVNTNVGTSGLWRALIATVLTVCSGLVQGQMFTPANFNVSPAGAATYSIPIKVAPGINGLEPKLALNYSSQAPNGSMGVGFSLSGLSAITRCKQTPVHDGPGQRRGVMLDAGDRFCLDGQRLIHVPGTGSPAVYGAPGSQYRTEVESFSKITAFGQQGSGPQYFEVKTKTGLTINYGGNAGDDSGRMEAGDSPTVIFWGVKSITDIKNQSMEVGYIKETANRQLRPNLVVYAKNGTWNAWVDILYDPRPDPSVSYLGSTKIIQAFRISAVRNFVGVFGTTANHVRTYNVNYESTLSPTTKRSRVANIQECGPSGACLPATTFNWPGGSITTSATPIAPGGGLMPGAPYGSTLHGMQAGDFDGDGKADFYDLGSNPYGVDTESPNAAWMGGRHCKPLTSTCTYVTLTPILEPYFTPEVPPGEFGPIMLSPSVAQFYVNDVNGDGFSDLIIVTKGYTGDNSNINSNPHHVRYWFCAGPAITTQNNCVLFRSAVLNVWEDSTSLATIADFDGDGRADVLIHDSELALGFFCPGTAGGPGTCSTFTSNLPVLYRHILVTGLSSHQAQVGDFNGDGKADLYVITQYSGAWFCPGGGATTMSNCVQNHANDWRDYRIFPGDYNGDGITDLYLFGYWGGNYFCQGTSLTKANTSNCISTALAGNWTQFAIYPGDFNGDGQTDFLMILANPFTAANQGYYCMGVSASAECTAISGNFWQATGFYPVDLYGRGATDLLLNYWGISAYAMAVTSNTGPYPMHIPDLLTSVTNGLGATISLIYKPITANGPEGGVYWKQQVDAPFGGSPLSSASNVELRPPMYVVQDESHSNGLGGGTNTMRHHYSGAMFNREGRGFLGFWWRQVDNWSGFTATRTYFRQDFPFTGQPYYAWSYLYDAPNWANPRLVTQAITYYRANEYSNQNTSNNFNACGLWLNDCAPSAGKLYVPFAFLRDDYKRDPNTGTLLFISRDVESSYDAYGNLLSSSNWRYDASWNYLGFETTVTNEYSNDPGSWILGRLLRSQVFKACSGPDTTLCN